MSTFNTGGAPIAATSTSGSYAVPGGRYVLVQAGPATSTFSSASNGIESISSSGGNWSVGERYLIQERLSGKMYIFHAGETVPAPASGEHKILIYGI